MKFLTGDIIKSTIVDNNLALHTGVILIENEKIMIAHNTPMRQNKSGGNVIVETLDDFLAAGRKIVSREPTSITYDHITASVEIVKKVPFDLVNFNCEDFISYVRTGKKPQPKLRDLDKFMGRLARRLSSKHTTQSQ